MRYMMYELTNFLGFFLFFVIYSWSSAKLMLLLLCNFVFILPNMLHYLFFFDQCKIDTFNSCFTTYCESCVYLYLTISVLCILSGFGPGWRH